MKAAFMAHKHTYACVRLCQHRSACSADRSMCVLIPHWKSFQTSASMMAHHCLWPSDTLAFLNQSGGMYRVLGL